jgi:small subunit ribosomal protein S6
VTKYEFIYIVDANLDESAVAASLEKYVKLITDQGGEVTHQESWGRKKLAYEIRHKTEGSYLYLRLKATAAIIAELNRALRFDESVLRTLIVVDEEWGARNEAASRKRAAGQEHAPNAPAPA